MSWNTRYNTVAKTRQGNERARMTRIKSWGRYSGPSGGANVMGSVKSGAYAGGLPTDCMLFHKAVDPEVARLIKELRALQGQPAQQHATARTVRTAPAQTGRSVLATGRTCDTSWDTCRAEDELGKLARQKERISTVMERLDSLIEREAAKEESIRTVLLGGMSETGQRFIELQRLRGS